MDSPLIEKHHYFKFCSYRAGINYILLPIRLAIALIEYVRLTKCG